MASNHYCNSLTRYSRLKTREVKIGGIPLGAENPIRIQSMTTTDTMNTLATVEQTIRMVEAGCEYVRITAPSIKEAQNLELIKQELKKRGFSTPIIADIHYTPNAAELAARIVEKVRVNPGNYADKKKFETINYIEDTYNAELERIRNRFIPLIKICKEYGTAMRIGTNHGSLSDRIMSRYGDTPLGMVESALEFVRICEEWNYHNIVLSMKASNPQVMVQAYRLLIAKMKNEDMNYPIHLGVTEAGDGEDGRIKSAIGIGTLLEDGIGDTIRVSLTEEPEHEIPVALSLVKRYKTRSKHTSIKDIEKITINPFEYNKRKSCTVENIGKKNVPRIIIDYSNSSDINLDNLKEVGYNYSSKLDKWNLTDRACDYIYLGNNSINFELPGTIRVIFNYQRWREERSSEVFPFFTSEEYKSADIKSPILNFVSVNINTLIEEFISDIKKDPTVVLVIETNDEHGMAEQRRIFLNLIDKECNVPVIINRSYKNISEEEFQLYSSTDVGALLLDGLGDGMWIAHDKISKEKINNISFGILQATRTRISKTEYISCPSCGRTLFDLQETTSKIRLRTDHLKGVKIGIMGCIVNGPGEMADADYGYVGTGIGKITLYRGKEVVKRNVESQLAVDELINLIKTDGRWVDREVI